MVRGSRKRRRADGRLASPPLAPSPLLTRNLQLLPVGLTRLPSDERFVSQLRQDIDELLFAFAEALLLCIATVSESGRGADGGPTEQDQPVISAFSIFASLWRRKGWHLIQFAFGDHTDNKQAFGDAVCRVLLEQLSPHVARHDTRIAEEQDGQEGIRFADLRQLFVAYAVPLALYVFWTTQLYADSGTGVKHCRPAMERIAIEQDYYDWLLLLPDAVLTHLQSEPRTQRDAHAITADLVEVLCRLTGPPHNPAPSIDSNHADAFAVAVTDGQAMEMQRASDKPAEGSKRRKRETSPTEPTSAALRSDAVFDIIPASRFRTRLPRTWPSVRVMSTLEANKEFGRIGRIVRMPPRPAGTDDVNDSASSEACHGATAAPKEVVAGLSRGDVVRLKARQRLAMASLDLSKLAGQIRSGSGDSAAAVRRMDPSRLLAETAESSGDARSSQRARYEIETPAWITSAKYTAKMKPWLEQTSTPMQQSLERVSHSGQQYADARSRIMPSASAQNTDSAQDAQETSDSQDQPAVQTDFGQYVLRSFREERRARHGSPASSAQARAADHSPSEGVAAEDGSSTSAACAAVDDPGSLSLDALYHIAAERTKTAAVARGKTLKASRARNSRNA